MNSQYARISDENAKLLVPDIVHTWADAGARLLLANAPDPPAKTPDHAANIAEIANLASVHLRSPSQSVDTACAICHSSDRPETILLCDGAGCGLEFHIGCLKPPLSEIPAGVLKCCLLAHRFLRIQDTHDNQLWREHVSNR